MKSHWTVGRKLGVSFGALIVLLAGLGLSSLNGLGNLRTMLDATGNKTTRKIELSGIINEAKSEMASAERDMILFTFAKRNPEAESAERRFQDELVILKGAVDDLRTLAILAEMRSLLTEI